MIFLLGFFVFVFVFSSFPGISPAHYVFLDCTETLVICFQALAGSFPTRYNDQKLLLTSGR